MDSIERVLSHQKSIWICQTNIFRREDQQPACNKLNIFATFNHSCKVINGTVGIAAPDTFNKCRDNIVMHLPILIV